MPVCHFPAVQNCQKYDEISKSAILTLFNITILRCSSIKLDYKRFTTKETLSEVACSLKLLKRYSKLLQQLGSMMYLNWIIIILTVKNLKITIMLELQKFVLQHVHHDAMLFKKELIKSILWLDYTELVKLKEWVWSEFGNTHSEIINDVFVPAKAGV